MEQKKVQRIIGILVVISLIIIVMPLLFGKNFPVQESANIKAPPFPDQQATHLASAAPTAALETNQDAKAAAPTPTGAVLPTPPILSPQAEKPVANAASTALAPASSENQTASETAASAKEVNTTSAVTANSATPSTASEKPAPAVGTVIYEPAAAPAAPAAPAASVPVAAINPTTSTAEAPVIITDTAEKKADVAVAKPVQQPVPQPVIVKARVTHVKAQPLHAKTKIIPLHKSGSPAWAVQVGNFAVKKNAVHLTNVLNAAGYKAFTRDVKTTSGKTNTRVYIGPQSKQAAATQLSTEINHKLNLQAFVVSYKTMKV